MKLALFFLSCFVGFSYQERYIWPMPYAPRAHLMPLFYADGQPAEVETAPVIQELDSQPKNDPTVVQDQEQRQLINLLPTAVTNFKPFTTTTTILSTSTLTVSTPTTVKCIASAAFSANSTSACARRRREIEELLAHSHKTAIDPAPPSLETTAVETLPVVEVKEISLPEIESSQSIAADVPDSGLTEERIFFSGLNLTSTVSVTQVATVYSYAPVTIKSTATIAANGSLNCLPSGYVIC